MLLQQNRDSNRKGILTKNIPSFIKNFNQQNLYHRLNLQRTLYRKQIHNTEGKKPTQYKPLKVSVRGKIGEHGRSLTRDFSGFQLCFVSTPRKTQNQRTNDYFNTPESTPTKLKIKMNHNQASNPELKNKNQNDSIEFRLKGRKFISPPQDQFIQIAASKTLHSSPRKPSSSQSKRFRLSQCKTLDIDSKRLENNLNKTLTKRPVTQLQLRKYSQKWRIGPSKTQSFLRPWSGQKKYDENEQDFFHFQKPA